MILKYSRQFYFKYNIWSYTTITIKIISSF